MRIFGVILIVIGVLMAVFTGFNFKTEKKVLEAGPLTINKEETKHVGWPTYTGALIALIGVGVVVGAGRSK